MNLNELTKFSFLIDNPKDVFGEKVLEKCALINPGIGNPIGVTFSHYVSADENGIITYTFKPFMCAFDDGSEQIMIGVPSILCNADSVEKLAEEVKDKVGEYFNNVLKGHIRPWKEKNNDNYRRLEVKLEKIKREMEIYEKSKNGENVSVSSLETDGADNIIQLLLDKR